MPLVPNISLRSLQISVKSHFIFNWEYPGPSTVHRELLSDPLPWTSLHLWKREHFLVPSIPSILKGLNQYVLEERGDQEYL